MATLTPTPSTVPRHAVGVSPSAQRRSRRNPGAAWRHIDFALIIAVVGVACFGALMIYSASRDRLQASGIDPAYFVKRQAVFVAIGLAVMVLAAAIDYRRLRDVAPVFYIGTVLVLLAVFSPLGQKSRGSQAWFAIGSNASR